MLSVSELYYDRGTHHQFTSLVRELARPGELMENTGYDFEFIQVEKPYESYTGNNVKLRCVPSFIRLFDGSAQLVIGHCWSVVYHYVEFLTGAIFLSSRYITCFHVHCLMLSSHFLGAFLNNIFRYSHCPKARECRKAVCSGKIREYS